MITIILAAGRGTRFGTLTKTTPKSLLKVRGTPILEYTLSALPSKITEVILVTGHLGHKIKKHIGKEYYGKKLKYVELKELKGTADALWKAKPFLGRGNFLVLYGDDLYSKQELQKLVSTNFKWAFGLAKMVPPTPKYLNVKLNKKGLITGAGYPTRKEMKTGILVSTGSFVLDTDIFKYKPVPIADGKEFGLPQTIFKGIKKHPTKGVLMKKWTQINRPEDIEKAEKLI